LPWLIQKYLQTPSNRIYAMEIMDVSQYSMAMAMTDWGSGTAAK
jgi:hypothetical protein